jgi:hypothetical protein
VIVFAHAGHWFLGLLYAAPVLIVAGLMGIESLRSRRRQRREKR